MSNRGNVVTTAKLARVIWGNESAEGTEGVKVYIYRLRRKLENDPNKPKLIINKPGKGFICSSLIDNKIYSL
jgi:two-component system KDP operon response regulator KdpE